MKGKKKLSDVQNAVIDDLRHFTNSLIVVIKNENCVWTNRNSNDLYLLRVNHRSVSVKTIESLEKKGFLEVVPCSTPGRKHYRLCSNPVQPKPVAKPKTNIQEVIRNEMESGKYTELRIELSSQYVTDENDYPVKVNGRRVSASTVYSMEFKKILKKVGKNDGKTHEIYCLSGGAVKNSNPSEDEKIGWRNWDEEKNPEDFQQLADNLRSEGQNSRADAVEWLIINQVKTRKEMEELRQQVKALKAERVSLSGRIDAYLDRELGRQYESSVRVDTVAMMQGVHNALSAGEIQDDMHSNISRKVEAISSPGKYKRRECGYEELIGIIVNETKNWETWRTSRFWKRFGQFLASGIIVANNK